MRKKIVLILINSLIMTSIIGCGKETQEEIKIDSISNLIASETSTVEEITVEEDQTNIANEKDLRSLILNSLSDTKALRYETTVNITTKEGSVSKFEKDKTKDINWLTEEIETTEELIIDEVVLNEENQTVIEEIETENNIEDTTMEETTIEDVTKEDTDWLVTTNVENDNYVISVNYVSEVDTATAKHYGKLRVFTEDKDINDEVAKYHNYLSETSVEYLVKPTLVVEDTEKLEDRWYTQETEYTGLRLLREILKNSVVVSSTENAEQYIITTDVVKNYLKIFDITGELVEDLYKGYTTVPVTYYIDKNTELLNRIVLTVPEDIDLFGNREVDACNYTIVFDEFNSINKVMIPDTVTGTALSIESYVEPTLEEIELKRQTMSVEDMSTIGNELEETSTIELETEEESIIEIETVN